MANKDCSIAHTDTTNPVFAEVLNTISAVAGVSYF
ncbi:hypothetical protein GGQ60_002623 [Pedobacter zeae]|uniref:Uncharacterized protein n=1 Tax=Pedobacter zeae TaxID=1737356 RepID=A0A7W6KBJ0_9SPHI|nr:hypothetical protein [Pedobacter zeae]